MKSYLIKKCQIVAIMVSHIKGVGIWEFKKINTFESEQKKLRSVPISFLFNSKYQKLSIALKYYYIFKREVAILCYR